MQEQNPSIHFNTLNLEEQQRLVGAFVWLIEEDKKQNPALYQNNKVIDDRHSLPTDTKGASNDC